MARKTTNLAALYIGTAAVQHIVSCTYDTPDRPLVTSDAATDDEVEVLGVGAVSGPRTMELTVEIDSADTTGQAVLDTAFDAGTVVSSVKFYPDGRVTGADEYSGSCYVQSAPRRGSAGNENKTRKGTYKLAWASKPTKGAYSV